MPSPRVAACAAADVSNLSRFAAGARMAVATLSGRPSSPDCLFTPRDKWLTKFAVDKPSAEAAGAGFAEAAGAGFTAAACTTHAHSLLSAPLRVANAAA